MKKLKKISTKYIDKLDEDFILSFSKKIFDEFYSSSDVTVLKMEDSWRVICESKHRVVYLEDFGVKSLSSSAKTLFNTRWQKELYKKFGKEYLEDLKEHLTLQLNKEYNNKLNNINKTLSRMENELIK